MFQVIITVEDGNDPPVFRSSVYTVDVAEDLPLGGQGWKFMSWSHCQELCQQASWLLIGCCT